MRMKNHKLKQLVADLSLDKHILRMFWQRSSDAWVAARDRRARPGVVLGIDRLSVRYVLHKPDQAPLRLRIHDLAAARVRYGYFRVYILLQREGWLVDHKRVYRHNPKDGFAGVLVATSARRTASISWRHRCRTRCGRWTSSRTRCSTADGCATNAGTASGSCRWQTREPRSRPGDGTITRAVLPRRLAG